MWPNHSWGGNHSLTLVYPKSLDTSNISFAIKPLSVHPEQNGQVILILQSKVGTTRMLNDTVMSIDLLFFFPRCLTV